MLWAHITRLVQEEEADSIRKLYKLTNQHIKLTSYGQMKVRYTVQVSISKIRPTNTFHKVLATSTVGMKCYDAF